MPRKKADTKHSIEPYEHRDKESLDDPSVGLVTPGTDLDTAQKKKTCSYDPHLNPQLLSCLAQSQDTLQAITNIGYNHWIITFSGGKDSTATLIVALETALILSQQIQRIDIVYSDTEIEIPSIHQYAIRFLEHLMSFDRLARLPIHCHIVRPEVEDSFWVCLLGKGYPPPHQRFRWCTRRLKIEPVESALKSFVQPGSTVIITGVRFGESSSRDVRLLKSCGRGGECGQGAWLDYSSRLKAGYLAPIAYWKECDVWDFLQFHAPELGYPTNYLEESVYNGRGTRFGCWMCTVVRQDKAMEKITLLSEWAHLKPLLDFRQRVKDLTGRLESRVLRKDGKPGRLNLAVRQKLLNELLELEKRVGIELISSDQVLAIQEHWKTEAAE